jgi:hypothetical protein
MRALHIVLLLRDTKRRHILSVITFDKMIGLPELRASHQQVFQSVCKFFQCTAPY